MITVNSFWHGVPIGKLEMLTMKSFVDHSHKFKLWVYDEVSVPKGVELGDANQILPRSQLFVYSGNGDCAAGSLGGFSDIFRYHLLRAVGGWYVDMDVCCLSNFSSIDESDIILRPHHKTTTVANIIKFPKSHNALTTLIEETEKRVCADNSRWILPVEIFGYHMQPLLDKIAPTAWFGNDSPDQIEALITQNYFTSDLPKYAVHWCRTAVTSGRWHKHHVLDVQNPPELSVLYNLYQQHTV